MKTYIGVKQVKAEPMNLGAYNEHRGWTIPADENPETEGYHVVYPSGYESWCPKETFETYNYMIECDNKISEVDVNDFVEGLSCDMFGRKTTVVHARCKTGFEVTETSACVDPANYDAKVGSDIATKKISDVIWSHLGFILQWAQNGLMQNSKPTQQEK